MHVVLSERCLNHLAISQLAFRDSNPNLTVNKTGALTVELNAIKAENDSPNSLIITAWLGVLRDHSLVPEEGIEPSLLLGIGF